VTAKTELEDAIQHIRTSEKQFFKMGEVGELTDLEAHVLRFWESEFPALRPRKNRSGHRIFSKADVELVLRIKQLLHKEGFTIAGAKRRLTESVESPSEMPGGNGASPAIIKAIREVETILQDTLKVLDGP